MKYVSEERAGVESRIAAIKVLAQWLKTNDFPDRLIDRKTNNHGFILDLVMGTVRRRRTLEWAVKRFIKKDPQEIIMAALLSGANQLLFMNTVADYAAVSATVDAVKQLSSHQTGFTNAVLRNLLRNRDGILSDLAKQPLAVRTSHPDVVVDRWISTFGVETAEKICELDNMPAETVITTLPFSDADTAQKLVTQWAEAGVVARIHPNECGAAVLPHGVRVDSLYGFTSGSFVVQDTATLTALRMLAPQKGEKILDCCAAPGGKAMQIASQVGLSGHVTAMDLHDDRIERLNGNIARTGFADRVSVISGDAASPDTACLLRAENDFNAILIDAPCSNSGVFRRRADARWRFTEERLTGLHATQLAILLNMSKVGAGRMVYSTCSIEPEEDEQIVAEFLKMNPGYKLVRSEKILPDNSPRDGAFAALFERNETTNR